MAAIALLILVLLFAQPAAGPKCPQLHDEHPPHYVPLKEGYVEMRRTQIFGPGESISFVLRSATTTWIGGKPYIQDGYATDTAAIEYNKRVRECQTANGEF